MPMYFACQNCNKACEWETRAPCDENEGNDEIEIKTVGNRFCSAPACIEAEAQVNGLPVVTILAFRSRTRKDN